MSSATLHHTPATSADLKAEFTSVLSGCAVFELGDRAKFSLSGNDRVRWLNGMVTNKVRDLAPGQGIYAFVLNPQGRILGDLYAYNRGESLLVDTDRSQAEKLLSIFRKYIIMDKVEIEDLGEKLVAIGVAGPKSHTVLAKCGLDLPQLAALQFVDVSLQGLALTILRTDNPALESYEIWVALEHRSAVWSALTNSGVAPVGAETVELLRIAGGIPRYGQDIGEHDLPQETEQLRALNFNKGCYIGQEIVERIRSRGNVHRKFTGFEVQGPLPTNGTKIQADGKDVGEITSAASLPLASGPRQVALGYIRRELANQPLQAGNAQLTATEIPFLGIFQES